MDISFQLRAVTSLKLLPRSIVMMGLCLMTEGCDRTAADATARPEAGKAAMESAEQLHVEVPPQPSAPRRLPTLAEEFAHARKQNDWHEKCTDFFDLWGGTSPQNAILLAESLPLGERHICLRAAFASWLKASPDHACTWLEKKPPGKDRLLFTEVLVNSESLPPARLSAFVEALLKQPGSQHMIRTFLDRWASTEPASAAEWMLQKIGPASQGRVPSLSNETQVFIGNWTSKDPQQAAAFIQTLPEGNARDSAVAAFSRQAVMQNPEAAMAWAAKIKDAELREKTLAVLQSVSSQLVLQGNTQAKEEPSPEN